MGLDALKRNKRRPKKGQALILLAITIILILIIFWNLLNIPVIKTRVLEENVEVQSEMHIMENALETAKLYTETSLRYSVYQACYDNLKNGGWEAIPEGMKYSGQEGKGLAVWDYRNLYADKEGIPLQFTFEEEIQKSINSNMKLYTAPGYTFLSNYHVDIPEYQVAFFTYKDEPGKVSVVAAPDKRFLIQKRQDSGEFIWLEKDSLIQEDIEIKCYGIYRAGGQAYDYAVDVAASFFDGDIEEAELRESIEKGMQESMESPYIVKVSVISASPSEVLARFEITGEEEYPVYDGSAVAFSPLKLMFVGRFTNEEEINKLRMSGLPQEQAPDQVLQFSGEAIPELNQGPTLSFATKKTKRDACPPKIAAVPCGGDIEMEQLEKIETSSGMELPFLLAILKQKAKVSCNLEDFDRPMVNEWPVDKEEIELLWPAPGANKITSAYGWRFEGGCEKHYGIDISGDGMKVLAATAGYVSDLNRKCQEGDKKCGKFLGNEGLGNYIFIEDIGSDYYTLYAHLKSVSSEIKKESFVSAGEEIGISGNTGDTTGSHLHFGLKRKIWESETYMPANPCGVFKDFSSQTCSNTEKTVVIAQKTVDCNKCKFTFLPKGLSKKTLSEIFKEFNGDYKLTLAAHSEGYDVVKGLLEKSGGSTYESIQKSLCGKTRSFVSKVMEKYTLYANNPGCIPLAA